MKPGQTLYARLSTNDTDVQICPVTFIREISPMYAVVKLGPLHVKMSTFTIFLTEADALNPVQSTNQEAA